MPRFTFTTLFAANALTIFSFAAQEPALSSNDLPRFAPMEPSQVATTFRVKQGFRLELIAAEPLVMDPIAMCFDEDGRLFVIEMRDYSERRDERLGRIKMLEDTDQDGRMDKSTIFAADLPWPTALFWYGGGLVVASTPDVFYFRDTNADGVADKKETLFSGFGSEAARLNMQQLVNSFNWTLDNRIAGANGGNPGIIKQIASRASDLPLRSEDFEIVPLGWRMMGVPGGAQHGLTFDQYGRKFVCSNSSHIMQTMFEQWQLDSSRTYPWPSPLLEIGADGGAAEVFRISPEEPWRVIRTKWRVTGLVTGPVEGGGRASGYFTSATGVTIYKGDALGPDFVGDAFIADVGSNLIHRKKLRVNGVALEATRPADERRSEFIASTDTWFRPVQFANAPDGALYVADMYREVIEHPWSIPPNLKKLIDLNSGSDRGRIYRIVPNDFKHRAAPRLSKARLSELVELLEHPNGWHRETAARLIYERQDKAAVRALKRKVQSPKGQWGRLHALYVLHGLGELDGNSLVYALKDMDAGVRENGVKLLGGLSPKELRSREIVATFALLAHDPNSRVRFMFASAIEALGLPEGSGLLAGLLKNSSDKWERTAIFAASMDKPAEVITALFAQGGRDLGAYSELVQMTARRGDFKEIKEVVNLFSAISHDESGQVVLLSALAKGLRGVDLTEVIGEERALAFAKQITMKIEQGREVSAEEVHLLARIRSVPATLGRVLQGNAGVETQRAALLELAKEQTPASAKAVFDNWQRLEPSLRQFALQLFSSRSQHVEVLIESVKAGLVTAVEIPVATRNSLRSFNDKKLRTEAIKVLGVAESGNRAEVLGRYRNALTFHGNPGKGKGIYQERCASCHKLAGEGNAVGPDLETVRQAGREALLANIIDPNREVASRYVTYEVALKEGDAVSGVLANESAAEVVLRGASGVEHRLQRDNISSVKNSGKSLMPEGLEEGLEFQAMADLLEYILKGE